MRPNTLVFRKSNGSQEYAVVDASMTDLIRPALYSAEHLVVPVVQENGEPERMQSVVGPVCESGDFLGGNMVELEQFGAIFQFSAKDVVLPLCHPGDLLAVMDTGAYGASMARFEN